MENELNLLDWWHEVGTERVMAVASEAGTSPQYMRKIAYRAGHPSYALALRIVEAAQRITPGAVPGLLKLLTPIALKTTSGRRTGGGPIPPSPAYLAREARL